MSSFGGSARSKSSATASSFRPSALVSSKAGGGKVGGARGVFNPTASGNSSYIYTNAEAQAMIKRKLANRVINELNEPRKLIVKRAFQKLDSDGSGEITIDDIRTVYNAAMHPEVIKGNMTEDQVLAQFLNKFEEHSAEKDGRVSWQEFLTYYKHVGADVPNDEYFILMVSQAWKL